MPNKIQSSNKKYDLSERTARFAENSIDFARKMPDDGINRPILNQFIRAATSIGANYMEADCAESKKDFKHKIAICKKESKETTYWLRIIAKANPSLISDCRELWQESHELTLIFSSIFKS